MDRTTLRQDLKKVPLFRGLSDADLDRFAGSMTPRTFAAQELLVRQGDPGDEWFLIQEGQCEVYQVQRPLGFERRLTVLGPGGHFGEVALFLGSPRTASVRALAAGRAMVLRRDAFLKIVEQTPALAEAFCRGLAEYLARADARAQFVLPFVDLDAIDLDRDVCALIPPRTAIVCRAIAVDRSSSGDAVTVAMVDPYDEKARTFLAETLAKFHVEFVAVSEDDFERYARRYVGNVAWSQMPQRVAEEFTYVTAGGEQEGRGQGEGSHLVHRMLTHALCFGASDLHFEPGRETGRVRSRIDGKLLEVEPRVPIDLFRQAVSRVKVLAYLDITEKRLPQDGSFRLWAGEHQVDVRVSTTPCFGGEKAVLRILDPTKQKTDLQSLVLWPAVARQARELFLQPSGLLLVTGPTGSGKTTTLYAGLNAIWASSKTCNIVTIEDPIEYRLPYGTQIQVNRVVNLDFARILRATLRQDPNIILVGEIRDPESGAIALEAAGTGHLVLSSLHTHFALDAITRLRNLGLAPYLIASSLRGIISQRLVAQVCRACAKPLPAGGSEEERLRQLGVLPDDWQGELLQGVGCEKCRFTGEEGRVGMYELLLISDELRDLIERNASWLQLKAALTPGQYVSTAQYARYLLEAGLAAPSAVARTFPRQLALEEEREGGKG